VATEAWGRDCVAFVVPVGDTVRVDCLATDGPAPASPVSLDALRDQFGSLSEPLGEALAALDRSGLQYGQLPREIPGTLCADGVASVGRAAHARLPGGCLGPALSIEDGWVLADALATYADRRRRRLVDVSSALREESLAARVPADLPCPFRQLCARRTVAFGHLFDAAEELVRDVPDRL
jgi:2-polyprenyl-6-methoxyphenol hydroxylase-like FAD-dependent oxidoreductase